MAPEQQALDGMVLLTQSVVNVVGAAVEGVCVGVTLAVEGAAEGAALEVVKTFVRGISVRQKMFH